MKVIDIINIMERIAPSHLAEDWDNCGLQTGAYSWDVKKIWTALDASPKVIESAIKNNVDMLIVHHPFIFSGIKSLNFDSKIGFLIYKAVKSRLSIFSAHTNFDKVDNGLNDLLAKKIGLTNIEVFKKDKNEDSAKLVFFVPEDFKEKMLDVLFKKNFGVIGNYSCCSFRSEGTGTFKPSINASPFSGEKGKISHEKETRIEVIIKKNDIKSIVSALNAAHPYETMAYDVYPLIDADSKSGFGRIGKLPKKERLAVFANMVKEKLGISYLRFCGGPDIEVDMVALCSGSGGSLVKNFLNSACDVYISGDIGYHNAREIEESGRGLIDIGHFASEHLIAEYLADKLNEIFLNDKMDAKAYACSLEEEPFKII